MVIEDKSKMSRSLNNKHNWRKYAILKHIKKREIKRPWRRNKSERSREKKETTEIWAFLE